MLAGEANTDLDLVEKLVDALSDRTVAIGPERLLRPAEKGAEAEPVETGVQRAKSRYCERQIGTP